MQYTLFVLVISLALNFGFIQQSVAEPDQSRVQFDIPPQSLELGLVAFSLQADINIIGATALLQKHQIPAIKGYFTKTEVLAMLLDGSGLEYKFINSTAVSISADSAAEDPSQQAIAMDTEDGYLQEIIVTAAGRETDLQKTPIAVSVFDQSRLDSSGVSDLSELTYMVPGLEMTSTAPQAAMLVQLHGVGTTNFTKIADETV